MQFSYETIFCDHRVIGNWKTCFMSAVESVFRVCWEVLLLLLLPVMFELQLSSSALGG
jgi:hypothetical protein